MLYRFDDYELDDARLYELRCAGQPIKLEPKVFDVLTYLIVHHDQVVSKDELLNHVWAGQFVEEAALVRCIVEARKAMGDLSKAPKYIATVRRRGYRFIAAVQTLPSEQAQMLDRTHKPPLPPVPATRRFIGRRRELALLDELLAAAENGAGHVIGLTGPHGIGKAHLLQEFRRQSLDGRYLTSLAIRAHDWATAPCQPMRDLLLQYCGLSTADRAEHLTQQVAQRLHEVQMDPETAAPILLALLGVPEYTARLAALSPPIRRVQTCLTLQQLLLHGSRQRPVVILLEHLQQCDPTSHLFFTALMDHLPTAPILMLTTFPSDYTPAWRALPHATLLSLEPLSSRDCVRLIRTLDTPQVMPEATAQKVSAHAAGNPLFLEALTCLLTDSACPQASWPTTLDDVLAHRLALLSDAAVRLLQLAAVVGPYYTRPLLAHLWHGPEEIEDLLSEVTQQGWCHAGPSPAHDAFSHPLFHATVYASIPPAQRPALHTAVAQALETLPETPQEDLTACLAYHHARGQCVTSAIATLMRYAEQVAQHGAYEEAIGALQQALAQTPEQPQTPLLVEQRLEIQLRLAEAFMAQGEDAQAEALLTPQPVLEDDSVLMQRWHLLRGTLASQAGEWEQVIQHAQRTLDKAAEEEDAVLGQAHALLAMAYYWHEQPRQGILHGRQAVRLLAQTPERTRLGVSHFVLGLHYLASGEFQAALEAIGHVQHLGEALYDPLLQSVAFWSTGWIETTRGAWEIGLTMCQRGVDTAPDPLNAAFAQGGLGYAYLEKGDPAMATTCLQQAADRMHQLHYRRFAGFYTTLLGDTMRLQGAFERAAHFAQQGLALARETRHQAGTAWAQRVLGTLALSRGALPAAGQHLRAALDGFSALPARFEIGRTHLALSELAHAQAHDALAQQHLSEAYHLFTALQVAPYVARAAHVAQQLGVSLPTGGQGT